MVQNVERVGRRSGMTRRVAQCFRLKLRARTGGVEQLSIAVPHPDRAVTVRLLRLEHESEEGGGVPVDEVPLHIGAGHGLIRKLDNETIAARRDESSHL